MYDCIKKRNINDQYIIKRKTNIKLNHLELKFRIRKLEIKIKKLEEELETVKKHTYVHDTNSIHCSDGELYIEYGELNNEKVLVMNTDQLYKDLPFIINQVCKQNKKMQDWYLSKIKEELKEL